MPQKPAKRKGDNPPLRGRHSVNRVINKPTTIADDKIVAGSSFNAVLKKYSVFVFILAELLLIFVVFHKFLLFDNIYLFKDIGSDSINSELPIITHFSDYFRNSGFPQWSFNNGAGKNIYPIAAGNPFSDILALFPKSIIPYAIIYAEVLKIFLAGLFFFFLLRLLAFTPFTTVIGGLLYSFCGYSLIVNGWSYYFSTEMFYASLLLFTVEKYLQKGTWFLVPVPFFLLAALQPFLLYLYGLLTFFYILARMVAINEWQWKKFMLALVTIGGLAFLGVVLSSFIFFSNVDLLLHIPRSIGKDYAMNAHNNIQKLALPPVFQLTKIYPFLTCLYRFFSNDLLGTGDQFDGYYNYLEAPAIYTGLFTSLLIPQFFFARKSNPSKNEKQKKLFYIALVIFAVFPLVFPFFRQLFWLFTGNYYRTYSLFLSLLLLLLSLKSLSEIDAGGKVNLPALLVTLGMVLFLLFYPFLNVLKDRVGNVPGLPLSKILNISLRNTVSIYIVIYATLISLCAVKKLRTIVLPVTGLLILVEILTFSSLSVTPRAVLTARELHQRTGYNDYTTDAVAWLNSYDHSFYRIFKDYSSAPTIFNYGSYNDALIQNIKGTASYDSFQQLYYCNFLNALNVFSIEGNNYRRVGCDSRPNLALLLNRKYLLEKQLTQKISFPYDSLTTINNITVIKYEHFLPFGYCYQNFISATEFDRLGQDQKKENLLLNACVIDSGTVSLLQGLHQLYAGDTIQTLRLPINALLSTLRKDSLSNMSYNENMVKGNVHAEHPELLFLSIPYDKGWKCKVDSKPVQPILANIGFIGLLVTPGEHSIELNYEVPYLKSGSIISSIAFLGYLIVLIRYKPRVPKVME